MSTDFFLSLTVFEIKGAKGAKNAILRATLNFHFSSNFDWIFFIGFLSVRAFRIVTVDFFYLLLFSRYKGPKRPKMRFWGLHKIFIFHPILMGFFHWISLKESFQNCYSRFCLTFLCQTYYCIKHIIVTSKY